MVESNPAASQCSRRRAGRPWRPRGRAGDQRPLLGPDAVTEAIPLPMPASAPTSSRPGGWAGEAAPDRVEQRLLVGEQVASSLRAGTLDDARRPPPGRLLRRPKAEPPCGRCLRRCRTPPPPGLVSHGMAEPRAAVSYYDRMWCGIMGGDLMGGVGHGLDAPPRRRDWSRSSWHATRLPLAVRVARPGSGGHPASKGAARAPPAWRPPGRLSRPLLGVLQRSVSDGR
jgi:hypothetical protein